MEPTLSSQNEQYLVRMIAGGLFSSKAAALDAAVTALREKADEVPFVPFPDMEAVEQGLNEADVGISRQMTNDDWSRLRRRARDVAAANHPSGS
jgi:hypothetical protein